MLQPIGSYKGLQFPIQRISGSKWVKTGEVWRQDQLVITEIHYDDDDPNHAFADPKDYPRLPKATVEDANLTYRRAYRMRECRAKKCMPYEEWKQIVKSERIANRRMAIHRSCPWETDGVLISDIGGFVTKNTELSCDDAMVNMIAEMAIDRLKLKDVGDFETADAIRREIEIPTDFIVFDHKDGTEFVSTS